MVLMTNDFEASETDRMSAKNFGLTKDIPAEKLPADPENESPLCGHHTPGVATKTIKFKGQLTQSQEELAEKAEHILKHKVEKNDKQACFQLGQLYFEEKRFQEARELFERIQDTDYQAKYQLSIILYDGLECEVDYNTALELMHSIAMSTSSRAKHLVHAAQYNVGRASFQGFGVKQCDREAEKWWLLAADDGNPKASINAQTTLGYFYSREETRDLSKAFFWHTEACGNGSLESQGALGIMYLSGLGVKKDMNAAFECLKEAAERGNVYAMGHLAMYYYNKKIFTKAAELASRVAQIDDVNEVGTETDCLSGFISKGVSMASFILGRCLHHGFGVKKDEQQAKVFYSRSFQFDPDICAQLQTITNQGRI